MKIEYARWLRESLKELRPVFLVLACIGVGVLVYKDNQNAAASVSLARVCMNSCKPLSSRLDTTYFKPAPGMEVDLDNPKKAVCFCGNDTVGTRLH